MALPKEPQDANGYPSLMPGTFVIYEGPSCGVRTGEVAMVCRRSSEGLMRNTFARVALVTERTDCLCYVPAHEVRALGIVAKKPNGWPEDGR